MNNLRLSLETHFTTETIFGVKNIWIKLKIFGFQYSFGLGDVSRERDHLELSEGWWKHDVRHMIVGEVRTRYFGGVSNVGGQLGDVDLSRPWE